MTTRAHVTSVRIGSSCLLALALACGDETSGAPGASTDAGPSDAPLRPDARLPSDASRDSDVVKDVRVPTESGSPRRIEVFVPAGPSQAIGSKPAGATCNATADCARNEACDRSQTPARCVVPPDAWQRACNVDNLQTCKLYRMRVDLDTGAASDVELFLDPTKDIAPATANVQIFHPAVSPTGDRIAFEYRAGNTVGEMKVCSLSDKKCVTASKGAPNNQGRWGNWLSSNELLFALSGAPSPGWSDVYRVALASDGLSPDGTPSIILGAANTPAGKDTSRYAFEDAFAFTRKGTRFIASHGNWPAAPSCRDSDGQASTDRSKCVYFPSSVPSVWDIDNGVGYPVKLDMKNIPTPWACAHVGVSPDGERITCTPQETYADIGKVPAASVYGYPYSVDVDTNGDGKADRSVKQYVALEYVLDETAKAYVSTTGREMFTHHRPDALEKLDSRFSQAACGSSKLSIWMHKFTEYCGDSDHIITAVSCTGPTSLGDAYDDLPSKAVYSAVFLIDITNRERPKYTNLTRVVEEYLGGLGQAEQLMSQFATCGQLKSP